MARTKPSHLAGTWYPGDPQRLRREVDGLLGAAQQTGTQSGPLAGVIVPHAGYEYSGRAAAAGYAALQAGSYQRAVILAPSHFAAFRGVALLDVDFLETPLGVVTVDRDGLASLAGQPLFHTDPQPYREEHSLEIQLPFLQRALPGLAVVPALVGSLAGDDHATVARALRQLIDERTTFIISSDFVHYGWRFGYMPFPAEGAAQVRTGLRELDMGAIARICAADAAGFQHYVAKTGATICGRVPIAVFLTLHARRTPGQLLAYYTSLDVTGDYQHCVSYASIAFPRPS
ncbi:MAG: AmmeMemoRadiSam system protein B [Candidatus Binatia bacterium]